MYMYDQVVMHCIMRICILQLIHVGYVYFAANMRAHSLLHFSLSVRVWP